MNTNELERGLRAYFVATLDREAGPQPQWLDSPAQRRSVRDDSRRRRLPLRVLAIAATLALGAFVAGVGASLLRPYLFEVALPTPSPVPTSSPGPTATAAPRANGWVAYATPDEVRDIIFARPDGTHRRVIGQPNDRLDQSCPAFSPDGHFIAYKETDASQGSTDVGAWSLVVAALDANGLPAAAGNRFAMGQSVGDVDRNSCFKWSPDGALIAVISFSGLQVIDPSSGSIRRWTDLGARLRGDIFDWAPNSTQITYTRDVDVRTTQVWNLSLDGSQSLVMESDPFQRIETLSWSRDGRLVIEASILDRNGNGDDEDAGAYTFVFDSATGSLQPVDLDPTVDPDHGVFSSLAWSPNGRQLALVRYDSLLMGDLGSPMRELTAELDGQQTFLDCISGWSPAGDRLLVRASREERVAPWIRESVMSVDPSGLLDPIVLSEWSSWRDPCGALSWQPSALDNPTLDVRGLPTEPPATPEPSGQRSLLPVPNP